MLQREMVRLVYIRSGYCSVLRLAQTIDETYTAYISADVVSRIMRTGNVAAHRTRRRPTGGRTIHRRALRRAADVRGRVRVGAGPRRGRASMTDSRAPAWSERYEMVVGLEVHVHLKTNTKIFCRCS